MSGYLHRSKAKKKQGKKLWFVIKDKVLYTYAASEVRCLEWMPSVIYLDWKQMSKYHVYPVFCCVTTQDVVALESQPLLGLVLKEDSSEKLKFRLYHKNTLYYIFKGDDVQTAQRYSIKR